MVLDNAHLVDINGIVTEFIINLSDMKIHDTYLGVTGMVSQTMVKCTKQSDN